MNWQETFEKAHAISKARGLWPDGTLAGIANRDSTLIAHEIAMVHAHLSTALNELNGNSEPWTGGFLTAIANAVIRLGDLHCALGRKDGTPGVTPYDLLFKPNEHRKDLEVHEFLASFIAVFHLLVSDLFEELIETDTDDIAAIPTIARTIKSTIEMASGDANALTDAIDSALADDHALLEPGLRPLH